MPSERRRQRQQRVRHEAGDFVPTVNEDVAESNDHGSTDVIKNESIAIETKDDKQTTGDRFEENRSNVTAAAEGNNARRKDERKYNHRNNEMTRGNSNRGRGGQFRGRGGGGEARRSEYCAPQTRTESRSSNSNVAYQEEKTYEPVMIMESKTDADKVTVPSLQEPIKYRRPEVISNWLRYEDLPPADEPEEGEDYLMGEDFSQVLNLNVNKGCGGYLHLKGEMSWGSMDKTHLENHGLGALKVSDLIASLGTIPLYEQLKIPEENLPIFCVSLMKADAEKNRSSYQPNQEYVTDIEINQKILESLKLTEQEPIKLNAEPMEMEKHDAYDATMKFSSAFKPEPTDVDLDTLMQDDSQDLPHTEVAKKGISRERSEKEVRTEKENTPVNNISNAESSTKETSVNEQPSKVSPPSSSAPITSKSTFDFGLSKAAVNSSKKKNSDKKSPVVELPKTKKEESPKIDISKPTTTKKEAPVLVKDSEVENLEDWLDSVLDD